MSLKAELPFFTEQMRFEKEPNTITITSALELYWLRPGGVLERCP
jgi:hypothetical protein